MEPAIQLVTQLGSFGLLCYIIFWTTRSGGPKLFEVMTSIRSSIDRNTNKLESLEVTQLAHTNIIVKLVEKVSNGSLPADIAKEIREELGRAATSKGNGPSGASG